MGWNREHLAPAAVALVLVLAGFVGVASAASPVEQSDEPNVTLVAHYPTDSGNENETLLTPADVATVGSPSQSSGGGVRVPVTLTDAGAESFANTLVERRFTEQGVNDCNWERSRDDAGFCLLTVVDGEVTGAFSLGSSLAQSLESGSFGDDPRFVFSARNESQAERIAAALRDGDGTDTATADGGADETATADAGAAAGTSDETADQSDGGATPGFTVGAALAALVGTVLLGRTGP